MPSRNTAIYMSFDSYSPSNGSDATINLNRVPPPSELGPQSQISSFAGQTDLLKTLKCHQCGTSLV